MGIINSIMHRKMRKQAKVLVEWATKSYQLIREQNPDIAEKEIFRQMLNQGARFPNGEKDREIVLDRYGSSLHGLCYYLGLNSKFMKDMMLFRCRQFMDYMDIELQKRRIKEPSVETKQRYFESLGLQKTPVSSQNISKASLIT